MGWKNGIPSARVSGRFPLDKLIPQELDVVAGGIVATLLLVLLNVAKAITYGGEFGAIVAALASVGFWLFASLCMQTSVSKMSLVMIAAAIGILGFLTLGVGTALFHNGYWVVGERTNAGSPVIFGVPFAERAIWIPAHYSIPVQGPADGAKAETRADFQIPNTELEAVFYVWISDFTLDGSNPNLEAILLRLAAQPDPAKEVRRIVLRQVLDTSVRIMTTQELATFAEQNLPWVGFDPQTRGMSEIAENVQLTLPIIWLDPHVRLSRFHTEPIMSALPPQ